MKTLIILITTALMTGCSAAKDNEAIASYTWTSPHDPANEIKRVLWHPEIQAITEDHTQVSSDNKGGLIIK